jgi:hypothetical protein
MAKRQLNIDNWLEGTKEKTADSNAAISIVFYKRIYPLFYL